MISGGSNVSSAGRCSANSMHLFVFDFFEDLLDILSLFEAGLSDLVPIVISGR